MARVKFQPTSGKGFENIPSSYKLLAQLKSREEEKGREMDQRLVDLKNQAIKAESDIQRVKQKEEANAKDINLDPQIYQTRESAINQNLKTEIANDKANRAKIANEHSTLTKILELAPKAWEDIQKIEQKDWIATSEGAYNYYMTHGMDLETQMRLGLIEDAEYKKGEGFNIVADNMAKEGYSHKEVMWVRGKNSASDYGRLKAYSMLAGRAFGPQLQAELTKRGITKAEDIQAFTKHYEIEYLKAHNLYNPDKGQAISADFLGPMFESIAKSKANIINSAELNDAYNASEKIVNDNLLIAQNAFDPELKEDFDINIAVQSLDNLYKAELRLPADRRTLRPRTPAEARDALVEQFEDIDRFPDTAKVVAALQAYQGKNNYYSHLIPQLIENRQRKIETRQTYSAKIKEQQLEALINEGNKFYDNVGKEGGWDNSRDSARNFNLALINKGVPAVVVQENFGRFLNSSLESRQDGRPMLQHWLEEDKYHRITSEDLKDPTLPARFRTKEYQLKVAKNEAILKAADYKGRYADTLNANINEALGGKNVKGQGKLEGTSSLAETHAEGIFNRLIIDEGYTPKDAANLISEHIKNEEGDFRVTEYGEKDWITDKISKDRQAYYSKFAPASQYALKPSPQSVNLLNIEDKKAFLNNVENDPRLIATKLVLKPNQIREIIERNRAGLPWSYPPILHEMSKIKGKWVGTAGFYEPGHVSEIWKAQVKLAIEDGILDTKEFKEADINVQDFSTTWYNNTNDSLAKHSITTLQTKEDAAGILQVYLHPSSTREPRFMSNNVVNKLKAIEYGGVLKSDMTQAEGILTGKIPYKGADFTFTDADGINWELPIGMQDFIYKKTVESNGVVTKDDILGYDGNLINVTGSTREFLKNDPDTEYEIDFVSPGGFYEYPVEAGE